MQNNIETLAQLEREKEKLKLTMKVTRTAFSQSVGTSQKEFKNFMLKKVALPVGAAGLGALAINQLTKSKKPSSKKISSNGFANKAIFGSLVPFLFNLVQTYMLKRQSEKIEEEL